MFYLERDMISAFDLQAKELLRNQDKFLKDGRSNKVGLESELAIYARAIDVTLVQGRDAIIAENPDFTDVELGANQIELRTPPIDLSSGRGILDLKDVYEDRLSKIIRSARKRSVDILRVGANPFLPTIGTNRTDRDKYFIVPDFYNEFRNKNLDTMIGLGKDRVDIGDASVVSLFQSFQVNLEANSLADACDKMNRSLAIAPYLLAFSGNARYLSNKDTRIQDTRMMSWEISHDDRTFCDTRLKDLRIISWERSFDVRPPKTDDWQNEIRVGLPGRYFRDMADYFQRAKSFPFILFNPKSALAISIGMTWLDTRVKFIGDSAIVELRLPSTQPTTDEELLLMLLYVGRLRYSQEIKEPILPMNMLRENRMSAMLHGMHGSMWFFRGNSIVKSSAMDGLAGELAKAKEGLSRLGLRSALNDELLEDVLRKGSPSDRLAQSLGGIDKISIGDMEGALFENRMLVRDGSIHV